MEPFDFGQRLRSLREDRKLTQQDIADMLGMRRQAVYKYENNINEPSIDTLKQLARIYNTDPNYLTGFSDCSNSSIFIADLDDEEQETIKDVVARLRKKFEHEK